MMCGTVFMKSKTLGMVFMSGDNKNVKECAS